MIVMGNRRARALGGVLIAVGLFAFLPLGAPTRGAEATTATRSVPLTGFQGAVARAYKTRHTRLVGTAYLVAAVAVFDNPADAAAAAPATPRLIADAADVTFGDLRPVAVPSLGEPALAYTGRGHQGHRPFDVAVLIRRDGRYLDVLVGAGLVAKPMADLVEIARKAAAAPAPATPAADLWARLPSSRELPSGFVLDEERQLPGSAVPA